jgi:hypothetical protein
MTKSKQYFIEIIKKYENYGADDYDDDEYEEEFKNFDPYDDEGKLFDWYSEKCLEYIPKHDYLFKYVKKRQILYINTNLVFKFNKNMFIKRIIYI